MMTSDFFALQPAMFKENVIQAILPLYREDIVDDVRMKILKDLIDLSFKSQETIIANLSNTISKTKKRFIDKDAELTIHNYGLSLAINLKHCHYLANIYINSIISELDCQKTFRSDMPIFKDSHYNIANRFIKTNDSLIIRLRDIRVDFNKIKLAYDSMDVEQ